MSKYIQPIHLNFQVVHVCMIEYFSLYCNVAMVSRNSLASYLSDLRQQFCQGIISFEELIK